MHLPPRNILMILLFFLAACWILIGWLTGFYTVESATLREWGELIASIFVVVFFPA
jgi:hypothetical protein